MKKRISKVIIFIAVAAMIMSMFTACSTNTANNTSSDTAGKKTAGEDSAKEPTIEKKEPMKLKLLGPTNANKFVRFEDREKYPVWQELEKLIQAANLELEYEIVPREQYQVVIQTRMASASDLPDIANISVLDDTTALNLAKQGIIRELNSLIEQYSNGNIKKAYYETFPFAPKLTTAPDGNMYWFSNLHIKTYNKTEPAPVALTMIIRKDWMEKLGLSVPTTADEYLNVLKAMRENDANGNGQQDEVLVYDPAGFGGAIAQWFGLGSALTAIDFETNKVVSPWYQPGIKEYFKYLNRLVEEGVLATDLIGASSDKIQQAIIENKVSSLFTYGIIQTNESLVKQEKAEYLPLMPLNAVDGIKPAVQVEPPTLVWQKYVITKACKNPEAAIAFFDMVYSDEYATLCQWGIEGQTFKNENGINLYIGAAAKSPEEQAQSFQTVGRTLYGDTVFPRVQFDNIERELTNIPDYKSDYQLKAMKYTPYYSNFNNNFLAIPTDEQLNEKTKILNNINTYSSELATKLALGQASLDDWDKYMKELKELGLDKLIEIDQELHDRYNSIK